MSDDWRPLRLRREGACTQCGAQLDSGTTALWSRSAAAVRCAVHGTATAPPADSALASDVPDWRTLTLRRPAVCAICGLEFAAGETAQWDRARRTTRCLAHAGAPAQPLAASAHVPPPVPAQVTGVAGGSAQAEYERRRARREQRVRDAHPVIGGLILALSDEPQHVTAWRQGAVGERAVARRLDQLVARGVEVLHDRRIPGTKANIDHIAVSTSGVYVIDAKNYTGAVRVDWEGGLLSPRRYKLLVGRRDATKLVTGVQRQVQLVRDALAGDARLPEDTAVTGVLAFFEADWPLFPPDRIEDVRLEGPKSTTRLIARDGSYTAWGVAMIAERLRAHFPEA